MARSVLLRPFSNINDRSILNQAFWTDKSLSESGAVTLFRFVGEFKHGHSGKNFNQLLIDFASGQCQLLALGIRHAIRGATCSLGVVYIFSSGWDEDNLVRNMSSFVPLPLVYSHRKWRLMEPVDFLTSIHFSATLEQQHRFLIRFCQA